MSGPSMTAAVLAALLGSACYQVHSERAIEEDGGAPSDAARPGALDSGPPDPPRACEVRWDACEPWSEPYVFEEAGGVASFHDLGFSGQALIVAFDLNFAGDPSDPGDDRFESRLAALSLDRRLLSQTELSEVDWPDVAWNPAAGTGLLVGAQRVVWFDALGAVLGEREVQPFGLPSFGTRVAPVPAGFLLSTDPQSGGERRTYDGALAPARPADLDWRVLVERNASHRFVPALGEDGFARYLAGGLFEPQSRVVYRIEGGGPGEPIYEQPVGVGGGPAAAVLLDERLYLYLPRPVGALFVVLEDEVASPDLLRVDAEALGVEGVVIFEGTEGDAIALGERLVFATQTREGALAIGSYAPTSGEGELQTFDAGGDTRPQPRLTRTSRGFAVGYGCGAAHCVQAFDCCAPVAPDAGAPDAGAPDAGIADAGGLCAGDPAGEPSSPPELDQVCVTERASLPHRYDVELIGTRFGCSLPDARCAGTPSGAALTIEPCRRRCGAGRDPYLDTIECDASESVSAIITLDIAGEALRDPPMFSEGRVCFVRGVDGWQRP